MRPHGRFAHCLCENAALTLVLHFHTQSARNAVLVFFIDIYYLSRKKIVENGL